MKTYKEFLVEGAWTKKKLRQLADKDGIIKGFKPGTKSISIKIWSDGTLTRNDVDLTLAKKMSVKDVVKTLSLTDKDLPK
jgi:hypothetical protein